MKIFGPHCPHEDCSWIACDLVPDPDSGVQYTCRSVAECPHCGPASKEWPRLAAEWSDWCSERYDTTDAGQLRARGVPDNVVAMAELVATRG